MSEFSAVTRCPFCNISFHVSDAQLSIANGRVRCGGCLRIFDAREHFIVEQKQLFDTPDLPAETPEDNATPNHNPSSDHEPVEQTLDEWINTPEFDVFDEVELPEDRPIETAEYASEITLDTTPTNTDYAQHDRSPSETDSSTSQHGEENLSHHAEETAELEEEETTESYLDEESQLPPAVDIEEPEEQVELGAPEESDVQDQPNVQPELVSESPESEQSDHADDLFILKPTRRRHPVLTLIYAVIALLAGLALCVQVALRPPLALASQPALQTARSLLCPYFDCVIEPRIDLGQMSVTGVIQQDSEYTNMLLGHLELHNRADFSQPLPNVLLVFRDLRGEVSASRSLAPNEYLPASVQQRNQLESGERLQLSLRFQDPGETSVSYEIAVTHPIP